MYYYDVLHELCVNQVRYLIVGGLSVNLHGIPRVTQDIDIVIALDNDNIYRVINVMKKLDYVPGFPVNAEDLADVDKRKLWVDEKNLIAFSFRHRDHDYRTVDIILVHPLDFNDAYERKTSKVFRDFEIDIISIDDLIKMKEFSGRSQDLSDIEMLKKLQRFMEDSNAE